MPPNILLQNAECKEFAAALYEATFFYAHPGIKFNMTPNGEGKKKTVQSVPGAASKF